MERGINPQAIKLKKSKILPPLFRRHPMWRSLHAAATYSSTTKNSYSKRKQGAVVRKTVVEKKNKEQLLEIELFKKKSCPVCPHETEEKKTP